MPLNFGINEMMSGGIENSQNEILMVGDNLHSSGVSGERGFEVGEEGNGGEGMRQWRITQPLPRPGKFKGVGPKRFSRFKAQFESYALSMWGEDTQGWKVGLETLLEGYPLALYQSYIEQGLTYNNIVERLSSIFKGETDPFLCRKLLKLKLLKRGGEEPWVVFLSRISNLLCEIYPDITEMDRDVRTREVLLQKLDNKTAEKVVNMCMLKSDFSPKSVFKAVQALDSIPPEITAENGEETDMVNIASFYDTKKGEIKRGTQDDRKHCLYCGDNNHYMADCPKYKRLCHRCTNLEWGTQEENKNYQKQGNYNNRLGGNYDRTGESWNRGNQGYDGQRNGYNNNANERRDQSWGRESRSYGNWDRSSRRDSNQDQYPRRDSNRDQGSRQYNGEPQGQRRPNTSTGQHQQGRWDWDQGRRNSTSYEGGNQYRRNSDNRQGYNRSRQGN